MKLRNVLAGLVFSLLLAATAAGLLLTREIPAKAPPRPSREAPVVDLGATATARRLALGATSPEEKPFARDAQRLADHETDLAFADALRAAASAPPPATAEVRELLAAKAVQEEALDEGQRHLAKLTKALAVAKEPDKEPIEDQLEVAKAQLDLEKDELDATSAKLEKLGADPGATVRRLKEAFTAARAVPAGEGAEPYRFQPGSLLHRTGMWFRLRHEDQQLAQAGREALARGEVLNQRHHDLDQVAAAAKDDREAAHSKARAFTHGAAAAGASRGAAKAALQDLKLYTERQRTLADLGKRDQDERELAGVYGSWRTFVQAQERAALHGIAQRTLWILVVLVLVVFADRIFEAVFRSMLAGRKRVGRNLKIVKAAALGLGAVAILLIIFGAPDQLATLFGLATAGLTVALKDFITAFLGWFILVGPKGIHVGDWVEIEGVSGEVVEIGHMRTLLMETGDWSDAGHPTGRVVSFVNSFALSGHYFNFSSAGQWLWDELTVTAPAGEDPYPFIQSIKAMVDARTRDNAAQAFKEWEQADRGFSAKGLKAEPGVNVVPAGSGVEIRVRYITRAQDRNQLRQDLNHAVVDLLHGKREAP